MFRIAVSQKTNCTSERLPKKLGQPGDVEQRNIAGHKKRHLRNHHYFGNTMK